ESENYVHRIGRTARAGKTGKAISFASEQDVYELAAIERYIDMKIPSEIAGEHLYAEDKSAGRSARTRERAGSRDQHGSESDPARGDGRRVRKEGKRRDSPRCDSPRDVSRDDKARQAKNGKREFPQKQGYSEQTDGIDSNGLSTMSFEERMAYYRAKYGAGSRVESSAVEVAAAVGREDKLRQDGTRKRKRRRSRQGKQSPTMPVTSAAGVAASGVVPPVPASTSGKAVKKGARGKLAAGKRPVKSVEITAAQAMPPAVEPEKTAKKGFIAKLLGVFKKDG
ncbi:MAG: hypothetical protein LBB48_10495, partial [Treponema sp.]|nr:hypothetical protein [Treponema sp.]